MTVPHNRPRHRVAAHELLLEPRLIRRDLRRRRVVVVERVEIYLEVRPRLHDVARQDLLVVCSVSTRHSVVPDLLLRDPRTNAKDRALRGPRSAIAAVIRPLNARLDGYDPLVLHIQLIALPALAQSALRHSEWHRRRRSGEQRREETMDSTIHLSYWRSARAAPTSQRQLCKCLRYC